MNSDSIYDIITRSKYAEKEYSGYQSNPIIGKVACWDPLGDKLSATEKACPRVIESDKYFTIRADGKNFSRIVPQLVNMGLFEPGYSFQFERIMKTIALKLSTQFSRVLYVFTQSDEITMVIDKVTQPLNANVEVHDYAGRRDKLISLVSSFISSTFTMELAKLCVERNLQSMIDADLPTIMFDARIGTYDSLSDAFELILWRAYDCSVNGVSQATYSRSFDGLTRKQVSEMNTSQRLELLDRYNMLPLPDHQIYGTLIARISIPVTTCNQKTLKTTIVQKKRSEPIPGPVIRNIKNGHPLLKAIL
jgi:tRNA(His) 5'-end guanylyltransferase